MTQIDSIDALLIQSGAAAPPEADPAINPQSPNGPQMEGVGAPGAPPIGGAQPGVMGDLDAIDALLVNVGAAAPPQTETVQGREPNPALPGQSAMAPVGQTMAPGAPSAPGVAEAKAAEESRARIDAIKATMLAEMGGAPVTPEQAEMVAPPAGGEMSAMAEPGEDVPGMTRFGHGFQHGISRFLEGLPVGAHSDGYQAWLNKHAEGREATGFMGFAGHIAGEIVPSLIAFAAAGPAGLLTSTASAIGVPAAATGAAVIPGILLGAWYAGQTGGDTLKEYEAALNGGRVSTSTVVAKAVGYGFVEAAAEMLGFKLLGKVGEDVAAKIGKALVNNKGAAAVGAILSGAATDAGIEGLEELGTLVAQNVIDVSLGIKTFGEAAQEIIDQGPVTFAGGMLGGGMLLGPTLLTPGARAAYRDAARNRDVKQAAKRVAEKVKANEAASQGTVYPTSDQAQTEANKTPGATVEAAAQGGFIVKKPGEDDGEGTGPTVTSPDGPQPEPPAGAGEGLAEIEAELLAAGLTPDETAQALQVIESMGGAMPVGDVNEDVTEDGGTVRMVKDSEGNWVREGGEPKPSDDQGTGEPESPVAPSEPEGPTEPVGGGGAIKGDTDADLRAGRAFADSDRQIAKAKERGDDKALATEAWRLRNRAIEHEDVAQAAKSDALFAELRERGYTIRAPEVGAPFDVGQLEIDVISWEGEPATDEVGAEVAKVFRPIVEHNGEIVQTGQIIAREFDKTAERVAEEAATKERMRAKLEGSDKAVPSSKLSALATRDARNLLKGAGIPVDAELVTILQAKLLADKDYASHHASLAASQGNADTLNLADRTASEDQRSKAMEALGHITDEVMDAFASDFSDEITAAQERADDETNVVAKVGPSGAAAAGVQYESASDGGIPSIDQYRASPTVHTTGKNALDILMSAPDPAASAEELFQRAVKDMNTSDDHAIKAFEAFAKSDPVDQMNDITELVSVVTGVDHRLDRDDRAYAEKLQEYKRSQEPDGKTQEQLDDEDPVTRQAAIDATQEELIGLVDRGIESEKKAKRAKKPAIIAQHNADQDEALARVRELVEAARDRWGHEVADDFQRFAESLTEEAATPTGPKTQPKAKVKPKPPPSSKLPTAGKAATGAQSERVLQEFADLSNPIEAVNQLLEALGNDPEQLPPTDTFTLHPDHLDSMSNVEKSRIKRLYPVSNDATSIADFVGEALYEAAVEEAIGGSKKKRMNTIAQQLVDDPNNYPDAMLAAFMHLERQSAKQDIDRKDLQPVWTPLSDLVEGSTWTIYGVPFRVEAVAGEDRIIDGPDFELEIHADMFDLFPVDQGSLVQTEVSEKPVDDPKNHPQPFMEHRLMNRSGFNADEIRNVTAEVVDDSVPGWIVLHAKHERKAGRKWEETEAWYPIELAAPNILYSHETESERHPDALGRAIKGARDEHDFIQHNSAINEDDLTAHVTDVMFEEHKEAYGARYNPKPVKNSAGEMRTPSGSTWHQWSRFMPEDANTERLVELYVNGYKPGEAKKLLAEQPEPSDSFEFVFPDEPTRQPERSEPTGQLNLAGESVEGIGSKTAGLFGAPKVSDVTREEVGGSQLDQDEADRKAEQTKDSETGTLPGVEPKPAPPKPKRAPNPDNDDGIPGAYKREPLTPEKRTRLLGKLSSRGTSYEVLAVHKGGKTMRVGLTGQKSRDGMMKVLTRWGEDVVRATGMGKDATFTAAGKADEGLSLGDWSIKWGLTQREAISVGQFPDVSTIAEAMPELPTDVTEPPAPGEDPVNTQDVAPTNPVPSSQQTLDAKGIIVTESQTKRGKRVWEVTGNTFDHKALMKQLGGKWYGPKKVWSFYEADPREAIAAALRGDTNAGAGTGPGEAPRDDKASARDAERRESRKREDQRSDERADVTDFQGLVSEPTRALLRKGLKFGIAKEAIEEQITDTGMAINAYNRGKGMFLIASEAGSGKTYVLGAAMREMRDRGVDRIVYVTTNRALIGQIERDLADYGLDGIEFTTYDAMRLNPPDTEGAVLVFDEVHKIQNVESKQGAAGQKMIAAAEFTLMSSATPFGNPVEAAYMAATGVFNPAGGHVEWAKLYGAAVKKFNSYQRGQEGYEETVWWPGGKERTKDAIAARKWLDKQGVITQRNKKLDPKLVVSNFQKVRVEEQHAELSRNVERAYGRAASMVSGMAKEWGIINVQAAEAIISMHRVNTIKRILEAGKAKAGAERARHHLSSGRHVVVFVETKAERTIGRYRPSGNSKGDLYGWEHIKQEMDAWAAMAAAMRAAARGNAYVDRPPPPPFNAGIAAIAEAMHRAGIDSTLDSMLDAINAEFKKGEVVHYTGAQTNAQAQKNLAKWRESETPLVLVATMAKGGTGLSLHDTVGDKPRAQVNVNLPWAAREVEQVSGRTARYGMASDTVVEWLFDDQFPLEGVLSRRVGSRMRDMGATVKGIEVAAAEALADFDFEHGYDAQSMTLVGETEPAIGHEPVDDRAELYRQAERMESQRQKAADTSGDFFATPYPLAVAMQEIAGVKASDRVLEPSAGEGGLLKLLPDEITKVVAIEPNKARRKKIPGRFETAANTFEGWQAGHSDERFDVVLMNPPFSRKKGEGWQDMNHVRQAYELLNDGGRLVAVMSNGVTFRDDKQTTEFRQWMDDVGATLVELPTNTFKQSGTGVNTVLLVIDKAEQSDWGSTTLQLGDIANVKDIVDEFGPREEPTGDGPDAMPAQGARLRQTDKGTGTVDVTAEQIINAMENVTGKRVPIRVGHGAFGRRKAGGWYDAKADVIRQKTANDLSVAAHEIGHAIHDILIGYKTRFPAPISKELRELGERLYAGQGKPNSYIREGIAEAVRWSLLADESGQSSMRDIAPEFADYFDAVLLELRKDKHVFPARWDELRRMMVRWDRQGAKGRVASQINRVDKGIVARAKSAWERAELMFGRRFWSNRAAPLEDRQADAMKEGGVTVDDLRPTENPATMYSALAMTYRGTARAFVFDSAVDHSGDVVGQSLSDVLHPIKDRMDDFVLYAYAYRAMWLIKGRNINPGITLADAASVVAEFHSKEFQDAVDGLTVWSGHLLDYVVEAGGLSQAAADHIRLLNPIYIPLKRHFDETYRGLAGKGKGGGAKQANTPTGIKSIKGSGRTIIDPLESFVEQAEDMIARGNKMRFARSIIEFSETVKGSGAFAHKVTLSPKLKAKFDVESIAADLIEAGVPEEALAEADMDHMIMLFEAAKGYFGKDNIVSIWRNGKQEFWELDRDVFDVVMDMDMEHLPFWMRLIAAPAARAVRLGATALNPEFALRNILRDAWSMTIYSKTGIVSPTAVFGGLWEEISKGDDYKRWAATGGPLATLMGQDRRSVARSLDEALAKTKGEKLANTFHHPIDALRSVIGLFESGPRLAEYKRAYAAAVEKYGPGEDASIEALLASKDVTVNFTRMGIAGAMLNSLIPFFNARLQGASKFYRTFVRESPGNPRKSSMRALAVAVSHIALPSLILWWLFKDEEWYLELPEWQRLAFWNLSFDGGETIIRIPKPFELGYVFGSLPEAAAARIYAGGDEQEKRLLSEAIMEAAKSFLPASNLGELIPALLKPGAEVMFNYDTFREREIIPYYTRMDKLPKDTGSVYNTSTSKWIAATRIGEALNVSPAYVDHLVSGYTGGLALKGIRQAESLTGITQRTRPYTASDWPLIGTFVSRSPYGHGRSLDDLYERRGHLQKVKGSQAATNDELDELDRLNDAHKEIRFIRQDIDDGLIEHKAGMQAITAVARDAIKGS